jgi:DNA replication protein DnaC
VTTPRSTTDLAITTFLDEVLSELLPADRRMIEAESRRQSRVVAHLLHARAHALYQAGFPLRALEAAWAARTTVPAVQALAAWDYTRRNIAVLSGPVGCGKTVAATWWALTRTNRDVGYERATTLAATVRDDDPAFDVVGLDALVLDDLGAEHRDDSASLDLDELVDTYYGDGAPLLITTSLSPAEFAARYGERVADRIAQAGHWQSLPGPSLRS